MGIDDRLTRRVAPLPFMCPICGIHTMTDWHTVWCQSEWANDKDSCGFRISHEDYLLILDVEWLIGNGQEPLGVLRSDSNNN